MSQLVGTPISRIDAVAKVKGQARYAADWPEKKLVYAAIFQSEIASGTIESFDLASAQKIPGVIEIMTFQNAPKLKMPEAGRGGGPGESFVPLQDNKVFYNGQPAGVVLAESFEAANEAAKKIKIKYSKSDKALIDFDKCWKDAYLVDKIPMFGKISTERGDAKKALEHSKAVVEATYTSPIENHNPMEPAATIADWSENHIMVYDSTQAVWSVSQMLAKIFELQPSQVHVITKFVGGGFGCKGSLWEHPVLAVMASKKIKRPVKLVLTREQMFTGVGHRAFTEQKISVGADANGKLTGIIHINTNNTAINKEYSERSGTLTPHLYQCENVKTTHNLVKMNYQVPTFMRAPGDATGALALECALDELSYKLNIDPIDLRLRNYAEKDLQNNIPFSSKSLRQCYEQAAEKFNWSRRQDKPGTVRDGDWLIGYGMATATYPARLMQGKARVEINKSGKATITSATQDLGTGAYTVLKQISADALGVEMKDLDFDLGDSEYPQASVSGGSTTTASVGTAVKDACDKAKAQLAKLVTEDKRSALFGQKFENLNFANGRISLKDKPKTYETYRAIVSHSKENLVTLGETPKSEEKEKFSKHSFGAQFAEVAVHQITGEIKVRRMTSAFACGAIVNPKLARSQFMGGMIFGIGMGLMEETIPDQRTGRFVTKDLADYHLPVNADVPQLDVIIVDEQDNEVNPVRVKGIGEIGIVGVAPAIVNAVFNATGIRIRDLPLTPSKMVQALSERKLV